MSETKINMLKLPQGTRAKLSKDEDTALKIIENLEEARSRQVLNARAANNARRVAEYKSQCRRARQQSLFKVIDVAMWLTLFAGIFIMGVMM